VANIITKECFNKANDNFFYEKKKGANNNDLSSIQDGDISLL